MCEENMKLEGKYKRLQGKFLLFKILYFYTEVYLEQYYCETIDKNPTDKRLRFPCRQPDTPYLYPSANQSVSAWRPVYAQHHRHAQAFSLWRTSHENLSSTSAYTYPQTPCLCCNANTC